MEKVKGSEYFPNALYAQKYVDTPSNVASGMLSHSSSNGCVKLLDIDRKWNTLSNTSIHPKHAQWVTCLVSMQAMEELGHFQLPGIVYRSSRHGAVRYHAEP